MTSEAPRKSTENQWEIDVISDDIEKNALKNGKEDIEEQDVVIEPQVDPNLVDWDGPDDPANPMNWTEHKKWKTVTVVSCISWVVYVPRYNLKYSRSSS